MHRGERSVGPDEEAVKRERWVKIVVFERGKEEEKNKLGCCCTGGTRSEYDRFVVQHQCFLRTVSNQRHLYEPGQGKLVANPAIVDDYHNSVERSGRTAQTHLSTVEELLDVLLVFISLFVVERTAVVVDV